MDTEREAIRWLGAALFAIPVGLTLIRIVSIMADRPVTLDTEGVFTFGGGLAGGLVGYVAGRNHR